MDRRWKRPMNCVNSARSTPSGGKRTNRPNSSKIGASAQRPRRSFTDIWRTENVMNAGGPDSRETSSRKYRGRQKSSRQNLGHDSRRFHAGELLIQPLKGVVELAMIKAQCVERSEER